MTMKQGALVISIDVELYWGVRDKRSLESYRDNLAGVWQAIPGMLDVFQAFDAHATWATVGLLLCKDTEDAARYVPAILPHYDKPELSPYDYLQQNSALSPVYHFSPALIARIASCRNQEIATHTFSHYYCREKGQTLEAFMADIQAAIRIAQDNGYDTRSIIFPRNQWNPDYLPALKHLGIRCFRGNESSWFYRSVDARSQNLLRRIGRFVDTYTNLCGHQTYTPTPGPTNEPFNFPASRLLRPCSRTLSLLEPLRLRRIRQSLHHAARHKQIFHLWWHPHNFGVDTERNISFLRNVLQEFSLLRDRYGMQSLTMGELCEQMESSP